MSLVKDKIINFRANSKLLEFIDAYTKELQKEVPWRRITRSDAITSILVKQLTQKESK